MKTPQSTQNKTTRVLYYTSFEEIENILAWLNRIAFTKLKFV